MFFFTSSRSKGHVIIAIVLFVCNITMCECILINFRSKKIQKMIVYINTWIQEFFFVCACVCNIMQKHVESKPTANAVSI